MTRCRTALAGHLQPRFQKHYSKMYRYAGGYNFTFFFCSFAKTLYVGFVLLGDLLGIAFLFQD
jgi:hypothetical protein